MRKGLTPWEEDDTLLARDPYPRLGPAFDTPTSE